MTMTIMKVAAMNKPPLCSRVPRIFPMTHPHDCDPTFRGVVPISQVRDLSFLQQRCFSYLSLQLQMESYVLTMSDSKLILFLQPQFLDRDGNFEWLPLFYFLAPKVFSKLGLTCTTQYSEVK